MIFTSDNGLMYGEHRIRQAKVFPYEESIRVPLMMRGPGVPAGLRYGKQAGNIDLAPTILDAADALPGRLQDGVSLLELAARPQERSGRELVIENGRGLKTQAQYRGLRNDRYVYIRHDRTGERELYDVRRDRPAEQPGRRQALPARPDPDGPARAQAGALPRRTRLRGQPAGDPGRAPATKSPTRPPAARSTASGGSRPSDATGSA